MRGHAVIIINEKPVNHSGFQERKGSSLDADNLQRAFCTNLGFNWLNQGADSRDLPKSRWVHAQKKPSCDCLTCKIQSTDHSDSECFLLAISTHGGEVKGSQRITFSDGNYMTLSDLIDTLSDDNCPSLKGKPRILIIQACRSNLDLPTAELDDHGFEVPIEGIQKMDVNDTTKNSGKKDDVDVEPKIVTEKGQGDQKALQSGVEGMATDDKESADVPHLHIPENFLIVQPSVGGKRSKRNEKKGSWLVDELCKVIDEHKFEDEPEMNFLKVLTKAAGNVAINRETKTGRFKSAVCIQHRLVRPLLFKCVNKKPENEPTNIPAPQLTADF